MHSFRLATTLRHGPDAIASLSELNDRRVLIVTDAFMATTDLMADVRAALSTAQVEVFDRVPPNPDTDVVTEGMRAFGSFLPDAIVALGGGSPIDAAKTISKLAREQGNDLTGGFWVIPTTSGSGSEVTSYAVITDPHNHAKLALTSPDMIPDVAILDPEAVRTAPPKLTADAGMDAASHTIEAYVARDSNDFSDALAEKSLRMIFEYLPRTTAMVRIWRRASISTMPPRWPVSPFRMPVWGSSMGCPMPSAGPSRSLTVDSTGSFSPTSSPSTLHRWDCDRRI